MAEQGSNCLDAVAKWRLEERGKDNRRYFFESPETGGLYNGEMCFVIGRKGSGKTAIAEHILNMQDRRTFARKLSFRNFPFKHLAQFEQEGFATSSRFTNIWKYITYITMLHAFAKNEEISSDLRARIQEEIPQDLSRAVSEYIKQITDLSFGLKILGSGGDASTKRALHKQETPIYERVAILENIIDEHIDGSTYYILYDELDDDFDRESAHPESTYIKLLGGLFRATDDIRARFADRAKVFPIVFLRGDIYDLMQDNNKAKRTNSIVDLRWQNNLLADMVSYRIIKAANQDSANAPDPAEGQATEHALKLLFKTTKLPVGRHKRSRPILSEIERLSYGRPRDVIAYLSFAAKAARQNGETLISPDTFKSVESFYSNYLITDVTDELHTRVPEIRQVFSILSSNGKASLHYKEVEDKLKTNLDTLSKHERELGARGIIDVLVKASVLGKQLPTPNRQEFCYQNPYIRVEPKDKLYIHRGLHSGLFVT